MGFLRLAPALVMAALLAACDDGGGNDGNAADNGGDMWFINLVTDSPTLGMEIAEATAATASYGSSSGMLEYISGNKEITFYQVESDGETEALDIEVDVNLNREEDVLVILHGTMDNLQLIVWENDAPEEEEETGRVGILQFSQRQPNLDVYLTDESEDLFTSQPLVTVTSPATEGLFIVDEDDYELELTLPGEVEVVYDAGLVDIDEDSSSYFIVADFFGADDEAIIVLEISGTAPARELVNDSIPAELRFINGISDYPSVDVYIGDTAGEPLFENIAFGQSTGYIQLDPDEYAFNVTPHGIKDVFFYQETEGLAAGDQVTLVTSGLATAVDDPDDDTDDDLQTDGKIVADSLRNIALGAQLSFVHASPSNENLDFYLLLPGQPVSDTSPEVSGLAYLLSFDFTPDAGDYEIVVLQSSNDAIILGPVPVSFEEGEVVDFYLFDSEGGGTPGELRSYTP